MNRKLMLISAAVLPFLVLNGCAIGEPREDKSVPIEKIDMSRYEEQVGEGIYKQILNTRFVDVIVDGEVQMFTLQDTAVKQLSAVKEGSEIQFIYALNEETREYEIHSISAVNGVALSPVVEESVIEKEPVEEEEEIAVHKVKMEVDYAKNTQIVEAIPSDFIKGTINVIDTYNWDGTLMARDNTEIRFAIVEDTIENDVQKQRWRAASILEKVGKFNEVKDSGRELDDIKFIFNVETDEVYKEVMLIKNTLGYLRVEIDTIPSLKSDVISEVVAMLNSIE